MSFLAWLYITATNPVQVICEQTLNYNSGNAFIIVYNDESPYKIDFRDCLFTSTFYNIRATINSPVTNKWFHLACVIDRSLGLNEMSIYFNGISQPLQSIGGFDASNANLNFQSAKCYFASRAANNLFFNGFMDDIRIYNRALSSDEILKLYNGGYGSQK